jgi:hypothetical protein
LSPKDCAVLGTEESYEQVEEPSRRRGISRQPAVKEDAKASLSGLECRTRKEPSSPCSSTALTTIKDESGKRAATVKAAMALFDV